MPPKGLNKQKDVVMQLLEALARSVKNLKKEMTSMEGKVEEIGTKVSDLEAQR